MKASHPQQLLIHCGVEDFSEEKRGGKLSLANFYQCSYRVDLCMELLWQSV